MVKSDLFLNLFLSPFPDETDRGVDQRDGKERSDSPGYEESDANKEENPRLRLPTCSDMICGYACLKGMGISL